MTNLRSLAKAAIPKNLRYWLRDPTRTSQYVVDRARMACGYTPEVKISNMWSVKCHPAARFHFNVFRTDSHQSAELSSFFSFATPGMKLLDVGAHYGLFALAAIQAGGITSTVVCVEPSSKACEVLQSNLDSNGVSGQVRIVNAAVAEADGLIEMLAPGREWGDYLMVPSRAPESSLLSIPALSLQSVVSQTDFLPTHIKLDVESYEYEILASHIDFLAAFKPILYLELHGSYLYARGKDPAYVIANLRKAGYRHLFITQRIPVDDLTIATHDYDCRLVCTE